MKKLGILSIIILFSISSCEKDIEIDLPESEQTLVVEGSIENGAPPLVILTRSEPFFSDKNLERVSELFVNDAKVEISTGSRTVELKEYSFDNANQAGNLFQIPPEQIRQSSKDLEFFVYTIDTTNPGNILLGQVGQDYSLKITTKEGEVYEASDRIPETAKLDSLFVRPEPGRDTLVQLFLRVSDPANTANYYRYFTQRNSEPFFTGLFGSVADDKLVDGSTFNVPIDRGQPASQEIGPGFGLFTRGDTVTVKFCTLTKDHYDFWSTLENDFISQGSPFSSPTQIETNISNEGLGVWGGYGCSYRTTIIPE